MSTLKTFEQLTPKQQAAARAKLEARMVANRELNNLRRADKAAGRNAGAAPLWPEDLTVADCVFETAARGSWYLWASMKPDVRAKRVDVYL